MQDIFLSHKLVDLNSSSFLDEGIESIPTPGRPVVIANFEELRGIHRLGQAPIIDTASMGKRSVRVDSGFACTSQGTTLEGKATSRIRFFKIIISWTGSDQSVAVMELV